MSNLYVLEAFSDYYLDLIIKELKGITYLECIIFFIVEIIFYSTLSLFIQCYKNSGLTFCKYLGSLCHKVSRINYIHQPLIQEYEQSNILNYETHYEELSFLNK